MSTDRNLRNDRNDREAREVSLRLPIVPSDATRWRFSSVTWENAATEPRAVAWEVPGQLPEVHLVVGGEAHWFTGGPRDTLQEVCEVAVNRFPDLRWSDVWWPMTIPALPPPVDLGHTPLPDLAPVKMTAFLSGASHRSVDFTDYVVAQRPDGSWWVHTIKSGRLDKAVRIWPDRYNSVRAAADRHLQHTGRWYSVDARAADRFRGAGLDLVDPEVAPAPAPEAVPAKVQWSLLPMGALRACAELATWGVAKHPNATWLTLSSTDHWNAAMRHMTAWPTQPTDPESGRSHLTHAAVRLLYAIARGA